MPTVVLIGSDVALLEGLSQTLAGGGFRAHIARTIAEAADLTVSKPPLLVIVERALAAAGHEILRLPLAPGGAFLVYHVNGATRDEDFLPPAVQRAALADLDLPLERQRLVALVHKTADRARSTGHRAADEDTPTAGVASYRRD